LNNYVLNIPSGSGIRREVGDDIFRVADSVQQRTNHLMALKVNVDTLANA